MKYSEAVNAFYRQSETESSGSFAIILQRIFCMLDVSVKAVISVFRLLLHYMTMYQESSVVTNSHI